MDPFGLNQIHAKLDAISKTLEWIVSALRTVYKLEMKMAHTLEDVLAEATEETSVDQSIIALVQGLKAQLDAVLAGGLSPSQQAKVDAIFDKVGSNKDAVAAAVVANTPADTGDAPTPASP